MSDSRRRKSSPVPLARALDEGAAPRRLAPLRRTAGSLGLAAAVILGASAVALMGCSDERVKRDDDRHHPRPARGDVDDPGEPRANQANPVDQFVDAIGDLMNPTDDVPEEISKPAPPPPPPTASTIQPDPTPPRPAGGISVRRPPPPSSTPKPPPPRVVGVGISS